jgi:putative ubiquitin-RnfH superfamily antitoxin RatB of RatAB toxin-antitoxin module
MARTQTTTTGEKAAPPPQVKVQVGYGPNYQDFDFNPGTTVREVVEDEMVKGVLNCGDLSGNDVQVCLNGKPGLDTTEIKTGDQVEIIKKAGQKA